MNSMNMPTFDTKRLILRRFTASDLPALFAIYADPEANTFLPWFPLKNMAEAEKLFEEKYARAYRQSSGHRYAICLKRDSVPIGYIHVAADDSHDLGYGLRREFWGQGVATEAGRAVIDLLRAEGTPYITATHDVNNPRSGGVMKRLGMRYQYSYEEQWQPKNFPVVFRMYQLNLDGCDARVYSKYWDNSAVRFREENV